MNITILRFDSLTSTNDEAAAQARRGASEGLVVLARSQTMGRGRHGRVWVSEPDAGLYFSVVLRPQLPAAELPLITLIAGIAVCDSLLEFGVKADIKWVNDLLVNEKKICGILAEAVDTPTGLAVILGIGVNLQVAAVAPEFAATGTSLEEVTGKKVTPDEFVECLVRYLTYLYTVLPEEPERILQEWQRRSTYFSGKDVMVKTSTGSFSGLTDGLEHNGALRVKLSDNSIVIVQAGDVEKLRTPATI
ncbi:MAG: biotin--acetyl-CoA-carboxylase ligase [Acidobacteria bacterium OLB17]|nr:MAG: biotin--acetyl-CoA-carboxylase ligase [Acidobacteria bacterium OLB17]